MSKKQIKQLAVILCLAALMGFALCLRWNAFWLPHWKGDQNQYLALALKLEKQGLAGYNLREIHLGNYITDTNPSIELVYFKIGQQGDEGDLIRIMKMVGQGFYDEPLHMRGPLLSYCLMWSHKLFAMNDKYYSVSNASLGESVKTFRPSLIYKTQFWAVIVPLFFNLMVILFTFILGAYCFEARVGLYAAFAMAVNPVSVMTAHRVLSEDAQVFFVLLSSLLFLSACHKKNKIGIFLSGLCCGLAVLTKQTALLMMAPVWVTAVLTDDKTKGTLGALKKIINPVWLIFIAGIVAVSGFWFWKVYEVYGNPLHQPQQGWTDALRTDITGWFRALRERPAPFLFFSLGLVWVSPIFGLSVLSAKGTYAKAQKTPVREPQSISLIFLWAWVLIFFLSLTQPWAILEADLNQEHRYFYPAYPAIAVLSCYVLNRLRLYLTNRFKKENAAELVVIGILLLSAWHTIPIGWQIIFTNQMLF